MNAPEEEEIDFEAAMELEFDEPLACGIEDPEICESCT
jgi:hypothetical protein